jgi:hypothetical protein
MNGEAQTPVAASIGRGADGGNLARRLYRRSPLRAAKVAREHRGVNETDVLLASYPRSGNAWLRFATLEMVGVDSGFETVLEAIPYVGRHRGGPLLAPGGGRFIKTHEPYRRLYRRAIYIARDPRDVALSYFRYLQRVGRLHIGPANDVAATFDRYVNAFVKGRVDGYGTWQNHVLSWRSAAENGVADILRLRYEDMRRDPVDTVRRIAAWLPLPMTEGEAERVAERCSFEQMRDAERRADPSAFNVAVPSIPYMGTASLGGWREQLSADQQHRFVAFADGMTALGYDPPT